MTNPYGKNSAEIVLIKPGAFSWYHGALLVLREVAHANARRAPAETELKKTLSSRMFPFTTPARETISMVCAGVYALEVMLPGLATKFWMFQKSRADIENAQDH